MKKNVIVSGFICLDIIPSIPGTYKTIEEFIQPGSIREIGPIQFVGGGPVFNTSVTLSKLLNSDDYNLTINTNIGRDELGDTLLKKLEEERIDTSSLNRVENSSTAYALCFTPQGLDRFYFTRNGANESFSSQNLELPEDNLPGLVHLGYPQILKTLFTNEGAELKNFLQKAKDNGYITSMDMATVAEGAESSRHNWKKILSNALPYTDIFTASFEDTYSLLNPEEHYEQKKQFSGRDMEDIYSLKQIEQKRAELFQLGANLILLRNGRKGAHLFTSPNCRNPFSTEQWHSQSLSQGAIKPKRFMNAIGAGDCASAGFIKSYLQGSFPREALQYSMRIASLNLESPTGTISI